MSTTTNVQSWLPYIFRPIYSYNSSNGFATTFNIRNIDNISASSLSVTTLKIGDVRNNVYLGTSSGNAATLMSSCNANSTTMVGISAGTGQSNTSNLECIGYNAGYNTRRTSNSSFIGALSGSNSSNVLNTIVIGTSALSNVTSASNVIAIGVNTAGITGTAASNGGSNIYIGNSNNTIGLTGSGNIIIGHAVAPPSYSVGGVTIPVPTNMSNKLFIGSGSNILIAGDFVSGCVSIGTTNTTPNSLNAPYYSPILSTGAQIQLDVAKYVRIGYGLGIGVDPGNYAMDVNGQFHVVDGAGGDLLFAPPVYNSSNGSLTLKSTATGGTMTMNVSGEVTANGGFYSLQSGHDGVSIPGASNLTISNALPPRFISGISVNWAGLVVGTVMSNSGSTPYYSASFIMNGGSGSTTPIATSNIMSNSGSVLSITVSSYSNIVISNSGSQLTGMLYNFTLYPAF